MQTTAWKSCAGCCKGTARTALWHDSGRDSERRWILSGRCRICTQVTSSHFHLPAYRRSYRVQSEYCSKGLFWGAGKFASRNLSWTIHFYTMYTVHATATYVLTYMSSLNPKCTLYKPLEQKIHWEVMHNLTAISPEVSAWKCFPYSDFYISSSATANQAPPMHFI